MILEPAFLLMYYGGFTWRETQQMPVSYKRWFINRINQEITKSSGGGTRAMQHNTPDVRALQGKTRTESPARNRRFT